MIIYTNRFMPSWAAGCAIGPFILIKPAYKGDVGLVEHERVHVRQWLILALLAVPLAALVYFSGRQDLMGLSILALGLHPLAYLLSNQYKLFCEVQAYKKQMYYYLDDRSLRFAGFIATRYNLKITPDEALILLRGR